MNNELKVSGIVLSGIISALVLIPLFGADTTIFLTTENGGTPVSCAPANGLVLAQNITDLCDVTIINATSGQIIEYNGTQWVNVNATTFSDTTVCNNLGSGTIICAGGNVNLKSLIEGSGIDITSNGTTITIASSVSGESTVCSNFDNPNPNKAYLCIEGSNVELRALVSGGGITLSNTSDTATITNSLPENTVCTNAGSSSSLSEGICINNSVSLKRLLEGTAITLSSNSTHITITNAGVTSLTSANSAIALSGSTGSVTITPKMELLCQTTLSSSNATISCNDFTSRKQLMITLESRSTGGTGIEPAIRFNRDSGSNYSFRISSNGGADAGNTNTVRCNMIGAGTLLADGNGSISFGWIYNNQSGDRKLYVGHSVNGLQTDDTSTPNRNEIVCKWDNQSAQISSITAIIQSGTGSYNTGSVLTVWGYD